MFRSRHLPAEIQGLLDTIRAAAEAHYACLLDRSRLLFESVEPESPAAPALRHLLDGKREQLFAIPAALAADAPMEDVFDAWHDDDFCLAFVNGRAALVVACAEAEPARAAIAPLLPVLVDHLLRYDERYRLDTKGRGLFFGRPRLDTIVVARERSHGGALPEVAGSAPGNPDGGLK